MLLLLVGWAGKLGENSAEDAATLSWLGLLLGGLCSLLRLGLFSSRGSGISLDLLNLGGLFGDGCSGGGYPMLEFYNVCDIAKLTLSRSSGLVLDLRLNLSGLTLLLLLGLLLWLVLLSKEPAKDGSALAGNGARL